MLDAAREGGGVVTQDQMLEMVASIGAATPYSMVNTTGGEEESVRNTNELLFIDFVAGGRSREMGQGALCRWIRRRPVLRSRRSWRGSPRVNPPRGAPGISREGNCGVHRLRQEAAVVEARLQSTELLVVCYDRQELVPVIKGHEQLGRTEKLGECSRTFDPKSTDPVPSLQYGPWLRADGMAARDGIATHLATRVLADDVWTGDTKPNGIAAFYGVGGEPDLSVDHPPGVHAEGIGLEVGREGAGKALSETEPLLHFRDGTNTIEGVERQRGPDIGEAELSVIHFIVWAKKYWGESFDKWIVSSVDTDLWMIILLAMTTGWLTPRGERAVDVTVQRVVGGETKFLWMNRVFASICELQDGSESAWPPLTFGGWIPTHDDKVRLFVLTFLESGCDYLRAISGLPFDKMWVLVLKSVRTEGLFDKPLFFEEQDGTWAVDVDECAKLLATLFFYKDEAAFGTAHLTPAQVVQSVDGDVEAYVGVIRYAILQLPKKKMTATCPSYYSLRKQAERGKASFRLPEAYVGVIRYAILHLPKKKTAVTCPSYYSLRKQAERGNAIFRNDISSGEAAESKNAEELEDPETDENGDGSVGALDDLIKLDSDESGSSDGESDRLSGKSDDLGWSDGDTDDGVADLVTDAWN
ncbi:unnamed protein product [Ectocarpus sp. CCAP 1310/34]|nr:unnamed protein product [Ectocarpus sp. CCAP 1310/34]